MPSRKIKQLEGATLIEGAYLEANKPYLVIHERIVNNQIE
jgi:hypothetical protein